MKTPLRYLLLILVACLAPTLNAFASFPGLSPQRDFFVTSAQKLLPRWPSRKKSLPPNDCRARIQSLMCLVDPPKKDEQRVCLPGGEQYAHHFEEIYDRVPPVMQKMFCSLGAIYIEKKFFGTAYAGSTPGGSAAALGIRQSVLDENLSLRSWATWKEQLSFGGKTDSYDATPGLPEILVSPTPGVNDFLYFVVVHEFGHFLDFANQVNEQIDCPPQTDPEEEPECRMKPDGWSGFSWETNLKPLPTSDFSTRAGLCFYMCEKGTLNPAMARQLYADLYLHSNFISAYAATNPWDDFADSVAYFLMHQELKKSYRLDTRQGLQYDVMSQLTSNRFQSKFEYIERLLQRADLAYPGPKAPPTN